VVWKAWEAWTTSESISPGAHAGRIPPSGCGGETVTTQSHKRNTFTTRKTSDIEELIMKLKDVKLKPLDERIVVEPVEAEEKTAGGIVLPDTAKEKPQRGKVLAIGPGKLLEDGKRVALSVTVGDEVIYGKYAGSEIEIDGRDLKILRESDVLAKVVK
jgi:chaperonin GroES